MSEENHAETVARLTLESLHAPSIIKLADDGRTYAFVPKENGSFDLQNITQHHTLDAPIPKFVYQGVTLQDEGSLVTYVNRFKNSDSVMFADIEKSRIVAAIDYHQRPEANKPSDLDPNVKQAASTGDPTSPKPRLLSHCAALQLQPSEEWKLWKGIDEKMLPQLAFVRFLEENAPDVIDPDTASLIETCRDLQMLRKVSFTSVVRTQSGNERIEHVDESKGSARGAVEIPSAFTLSIPVYFGGETYHLAARLRFELDEGTLKLGIKLVRAESLRQEAFRSIVSGLILETDTTVVYGSIVATPASYRGLPV